MTNAEISNWVFDALDYMGPVSVDYMTDYIFKRQAHFTRLEVMTIVRTVASQTSDLY